MEKNQSEKRTTINGIGRNMKIKQLIKEAEKVLAEHGDLEVHCTPYKGRFCEACWQTRPTTKYGEARRTYTDADSPYWFMIEFNRDTPDGADSLPEEER